MFVSLTNPKIMLFFLAVLPQFLGSAKSPGLQMAMLGAVDVLMEVVLYGAIGLLAGVFHARFAGKTKVATVLNYVACVVYVVLAVTIIVDVLLTEPLPVASVKGCADPSSGAATTCEFVRSPLGAD